LRLIDFLLKLMWQRDLSVEYRVSVAHQALNARSVAESRQGVGGVRALRSCVVDGEAIVCDDSGLAVFDLIRGHGTNGRAVLCAFDLLEVNGEDLRREPIEERKRRLAGLLRLPHEGIALNGATESQSSNTPALLAARVSCRSASARPIAQAG
jgi:hypothetical protein